jgi:hypothetical protein
LGQRLKRFAFFLLAILTGVGLGLVLGWEVMPVRCKDTGLHMLRQDYKTDYVLMVAETYSEEGDIAMAMARLAYLGDESPTTLTQDAIAYAQEIDYSPDDLERMLKLSEDLQQLPLEVQ